MSDSPDASDPSDHRGSEDGVRILRDVRRIVRHVSRYSRRVSQETGLAVPQMLCLRAIADADRGSDVTLARVATTVQISNSTASTLVDKLVRDGLVARARSTRDRRRIDLSLTPEGRQRLDGLSTTLEARTVDRFAALPAPEREQILWALERLVDVLGADDLDASPVLTPGKEL
jgi:DNA-binding MarR family transcriptional regulator